jgi:hypothetical protein
MKKMAIIGVSVVMVLLASGMAGADMVNIGTGQMERSEFDALKAMIQGRQTAAKPAVSTPSVNTERYGMVEMTVEAYESLRDQVAGRTVNVLRHPVNNRQMPMVDIGTGRMPQDEFLALKQMVEGKEESISNHLAVFLP